MSKMKDSPKIGHIAPNEQDLAILCIVSDCFDGPRQHTALVMLATKALRELSQASGRPVTLLGRSPCDDDLRSFCCESFGGRQSQAGGSACYYDGSITLIRYVVASVPQRHGCCRQLQKSVCGRATVLADLHSGGSSVRFSGKSRQPCVAAYVQCLH